MTSDFLPCFFPILDQIQFGVGVCVSVRARVCGVSGGRRWRVASHCVREVIAPRDDQTSTLDPL